MDRIITERGCDVHQALEDSWVVDGVARFAFSSTAAAPVEFDLCSACQSEYGVDRLVKILAEVHPKAMAAMERKPRRSYRRRSGAKTVDATGRRVSPSVQLRTEEHTGAKPKEVRVWAAANGIECPPRGRVPFAVQEAYIAAQHTAA